MVSGRWATIVLFVFASTSKGATLPIYVEELRVESAEWVDEFDAGDLRDGDKPFEPLYWVGARTPPKIQPFPPCATDNFESGGLATIGGFGCDVGGFLPSAMVVGGDATLRTTFRMPPDFRDLDAFGLGFSNLFNRDAAWLLVQRIDALGGVFAQLLSDPGILTGSLVDAQRIELPANTEEVEFEITLDVQQTPGEAPVRVPEGFVRACGPTECRTVGPVRCEAAPAGTGLACRTGSLDGGTVATSTISSPNIIALRNGSLDSFSVDVDSYSQIYVMSDDFEDGIEGGLPFVLDPFPTSCATSDSLIETNGALEMGSPQSCQFRQTSAQVRQLVAAPIAASTPADQTVATSFRFKVPERCEAYGSSLGAVVATIDPTDPDPYETDFPPSVFPLVFLDFASIMLVRGRDPHDPIGNPDVLRVVLGSESMAPFGGPELPTIASSTISTHPDDDPQLRGITHIELELEVQGSLPAARFRLCTHLGCPASFTELQVYPSTPVPDLTVCGLTANQFDPPIDIPAIGVFAADGRLQSGAPLSPSIFAVAVPEPSRTAVVAILALAGLALSKRGRSTPPQ